MAQGCPSPKSRCSRAAMPPGVAQLTSMSRCVPSLPKFASHTNGAAPRLGMRGTPTTHPARSAGVCADPRRGADVLAPCERLQHACGVMRQLLRTHVLQRVVRHRHLRTRHEVHHHFRFRLSRLQLRRAHRPLEFHCPVSGWCVARHPMWPDGGRNPVAPPAPLTPAPQPCPQCRKISLPTPRLLNLHPHALHRSDSGRACLTARCYVLNRVHCE